MDADEEEGLRAFALTVAADGTTGRPLWVERDGKRAAVAAIEAEWTEAERRGFRVLLTDGSALLLYYVPELDIWSGAGLEGVESRFVPRTNQA